MHETGGPPRVRTHFSLRLEVSKTTVDSLQESVGVLRAPIKRDVGSGLLGSFTALRAVSDLFSCSKPWVPEGLVSPSLFGACSRNSRA